MSPHALRSSWLPLLFVGLVAAVEAHPAPWAEGVGVPVGERDLRFDTAAGPVLVARSQLEDGEVDHVLGGILERLADHAPAVTPWRARYDHLLGCWTLSSDDRIATPTGLLQRVDIGTGEATDRLEGYRTAVAGLRTDLPASGLPARARDATDTLLWRLVEPDPEQEPHLDPPFLRRLVRAGFLGRELGARPAVAALERAVATAMRFEPIRRWTAADGREVVVERDAFGRERRWAVLDGQRVWSLPAPRPALCPAGPWDQPRLLLRLPAGLEPTRETLRTHATATLLLDDAAVARWTPDRGLELLTGDWPRIDPASVHMPDVAPGLLPPHIAVCDLDGDPLLLGLPGGRLDAPEASVDGAAYLARAAELLPDAAHLDLFGQYFFTYTHDSPDPRHPGLIGNERQVGDIHQTAGQLLATSLAGTCRGDCDDLVEFLHDILQRQGRLPVVIDLPAHLAVAWAERHDERWLLTLCQTGWTLQFAAAELPAALSALYAHFDPHRAGHDPEIVALTLRFAGENTRSPFWLSWRIFTEPDYAAALYDVQRDLYFGTYGHGFQTMDALVAAGDHDPANWSELDGLCKHIGEWDRAIDHLQRTIDQQPPGPARYRYQLEQLGTLIRAERWDEVHAVIDELAALDLATLAPDDYLQQLRLAWQLVDLLDHDELARRGDELFDRLLLTPTGGLQGWLIGLLADEQIPDQAWNQDPTLRTCRELAWNLSGRIQTRLHRRGAALTRHERLVLGSLVQRNHQHLAFLGLNDPELTVYAYGALGWFYHQQLGADALRLIEAAPWVAIAAPDTASRGAGLAQMLADLPSIRSSPDFWDRLIMERIGTEEDAFPAMDAELAGWYRQFEQAHQRLEAQGIRSSGLDAQRRGQRLYHALITDDEAALGAIFDEIVALDDRTLHRWLQRRIAMTAGRLDPQRWSRLADLWFERVAHKPSCFRIAWMCVIWDQEEAGLAWARRIPAAFPSEPRFAEELAFLERTLAQRAAAAASEKTVGTEP